MSDGLTPHHELWEELRRRVGAEDRITLARHLGIPDGNATRNFYRWYSATRGGYESTIAVLDALGFLTEPGRAFLALGKRPGEDESLEAARRASDRAHEMLEVEAEQVRRSARRSPRRGRS